MKLWIRKNKLEIDDFNEKDLLGIVTTVIVDIIHKDNKNFGLLSLQYSNTFKDKINIEDTEVCEFYIGDNYSITFKTKAAFCGDIDLGHKGTCSPATIENVAYLLKFLADYYNLEKPGMNVLIEYILKRELSLIFKEDNNED